MPPESRSLIHLLTRIRRLFRRRRTVHVTVPAGERAVSFVADQDGLRAGDRIVVHWERDDA